MKLSTSLAFLIIIASSFHAYSQDLNISIKGAASRPYWKSIFHKGKSNVYSPRSGYILGVELTKRLNESRPFIIGAGLTTRSSSIDVKINSEVIVLKDAALHALLRYQYKKLSVGLNASAHFVYQKKKIDATPTRGINIDKTSKAYGSIESELRFKILGKLSILWTHSLLSTKIYTSYRLDRFGIPDQKVSTYFRWNSFGLSYDL